MLRKLAMVTGTTLLALVSIPLLMLLALLVFYLVGRAAYSIPFDPAVQGVVDVIVVDIRSDDDTQFYYTIAADGRRQETEPFTPDEMVVHRIYSGSLESYIDREKNKVLNRLTDILVYDDHGKLTENENPLVERVMQQAAKLEHDIMELRIMEVGEHVFLYVELNVNWYCPCDLYYYDADADRLYKLYSFNELETVGIRVQDVERLR